jgi:hypothetical protein
MSNFGRIIRVLAGALAFSAMAPAGAATIQLRAWLNGAQEVPPVATAATGLAVVTYDTMTGQLNWNVSYSGLSSAINGAHFHGPTPAGFDAGITVGMTTGPSPIIGLATINAAEAAQMLSGQWYVNIHSNSFGGGEIRGQVLPVRGDLNGDGQSDIVWRNASTGENYLYPMNGITILGSEGYLRTVADQNWQIAGIGDLNGDGQSDIVWRNASTGENYLYPMNGATILGTEGYLRTVADQSWQVGGVGDFNGDGKADILWRHTDGTVLAWLMGPALTVTSVASFTASGSPYSVTHVRDLDRDGKADILWRHSDGSVQAWLMNGVSAMSVAGFTGPGSYLIVPPQP